MLLHAVLNEWMLDHPVVLSDESVASHECDNFRLDLPESPSFDFYTNDLWRHLISKKYKL